MTHFNELECTFLQFNRAAPSLRRRPADRNTIHRRAGFMSFCYGLFSHGPPLFIPFTAGGFFVANCMKEQTARMATASAEDYHALTVYL